MAAGSRKWRTRCRLGAVLFAILLQVVNGYEQVYTISQVSPKSASVDSPRDIVLETSQAENLDISIQPSIEQTLEKEHTIVERSANPDIRGSSSINIDETPANNEIDNELEMHNKRKYYDLHPTKTVSYHHESDDDIALSSEGFGDKLNFRFPGEGNRVPRARLLPPTGPKIRPTAAQPIFATATYRDEGRQNTEIQNIITGLVKLLNGNVNVQANSQLLNGRPTRPIASRINNRGPPRISDAPSIPDFDKPLNLPTHNFYPTKTPPPYPFDLPPHHGVNLPEQIVPPLTPPRPGLHRPMPPWPRPWPRPPSPRPKPGLPIYMPTPQPAPIDIPDLDDIIKDIMTKPESERPVSENETSHSENNIHHEEDKETLTNLPDVNTTEEIEEKFTTIADTTTTSTTTTEKVTTTEKQTTTTEKPTTTTEKITEKPTTTTEGNEKPYITERITTEKTTTEKVKIDKAKLDKDKKKDSSYSEKEKPKDKIKLSEDKAEKTNLPQTLILESSLNEEIPTSFYLTPTPTEALLHTTSIEASTTEIIKTSINTLPISTSTDVPYHPYRPRPGIVLDDTDFKPHGTRVRSEASIITAAETGMPWYGEIFNVTVSAIQGPGGKGGSAHIETVSPISGHEHDDIIVSPSGEQGFVSIDGKRTYLDILGSSTVVTASTADVKPTHIPQFTVPPPPSLGTGVAIPDDDATQPVKRPPPIHRPAPTRPPSRSPTVRIDTCIVGDDSTCDTAQNEMCRTESGISSCQCRPGYAKRIHREPCRRVVSLILNMRVDRLDYRKIAWDQKLADKESDPYQQLSYEAVRAIDSAFSMTPFSDDFVSGSVNSVYKGDQANQGVFVNYTILMQETGETLRPAVAAEIQKHLLGVIKRRSNNIGSSVLWVDSPAGSVLPLKDFDECASPDFNDCHQLATCTNTWGGFKCACPASHRDAAGGAAGTRAGRACEACAPAHCNERGVCAYRDNQPYCSCSSGYYGSTCEVDGEVVGVAVGASLAAALVIALTLAALMSWSRKWSREQKAAGMGSPVFNYMTANTIKTPPVGQPPYQVTLEERMRWAQIAEAMAQSNHYAQEPAHTMATRPSSALFGYPTLPPVPLPRMGLHHTGTLNTLASRVNTTAPSHHNLYGYSNHMASESSSEASSHVQERADLLVPRPKSRARSMHNQTGIYCDVDYENTPDNIYGTKGIPLSTYTVSRGPPFYRT